MCIRDRSAAVPRMESGSFSKRGYRLSAALIRFKLLQQFEGFVGLKSQEWSSGTTWECHDATVTFIRGVEVPGIVSWHDLGLSGRNIPFDSRC
eukprot:1000267-Pyramimonas_sp.AAC.1